MGEQKFGLGCHRIVGIYPGIVVRDCMYIYILVCTCTYTNMYMCVYDIDLCAMEAQLPLCRTEEEA